ncbi:MAG: thioredoxin [Chloroflexi bacterium]|nr:thioredoxin [Chloroflexota bacterium]
MAAGFAVLEVSDADFATEVLERSKTVPVVVDFWAPWCGPCRVLGPVIEKVAAEHTGEVVLAKLNTDDNPRVATQYRIQGIPAVKAFRDGRMVSEFTGAVPEPQVRAFFQKLVPSEAERAAREAEDLIHAGDTAAAEARYREILAKQRSNPDAVIGLAGMLMERGETEEAADLLERVPADRRAKVLKHRIFLDNFAAKHSGENFAAEVSANPRDPRAHYRWGVMLAAGAQYEAALDQLLESVALDKTFAEGAARKAVLAIFDLLGLEAPLTREYQRRLSQLLF